MTKYDVIIVGGGPAGCATALALSRHNVFRILVVEAGAYQAIRVGESIPPDTRLLLDKLGIWDDFLEEKHEACLGSCSSWGSDELGYNDFLFNPHGNGWHLDRRHFDSFLAKKTIDSGVSFSQNTKFLSAKRVGSEGFRLRLQKTNGQEIIEKTKFVVDASGIHARFSRQMGAARLFNDRLICVTAFFNLSPSSHFSRLTMLEAAEYGWWYAAKLPNAILAIAVASDPEIIKQAGLNKKENWLRYLKGTKYISRELEGCHFIGNSLRPYIAPSFLLNKASSDNNDCWLAVGDAASAYDPISSQGIYKALSDGIQAADVIADHLSGKSGRLIEYQSFISSQFNDYLKNRNYFYGLEKRWPASSFWKRRQNRTLATFRKPWAKLHI